MRNKSVFYLLLVGLLSVGLMLTACGHTTELGDGISEIPHDVGLGFTNCLVCHTGGFHPVPVDHTEDEYPLETCTLPACHLLSGEVAPPVVEITSHEVVGAHQGCLICHDVYKRYEFPIVTEHTIHTNEVCFICHEVAGE